MPSLQVTVLLVARRFIALGIVGLLGGCGAGRSAAPDTVYLGPEDENEAARYLPLEDGIVYTYDTHLDGSTRPGLMTIQVRRTREGRVTRRFGGRTQHLRTLPDGISSAEGGYLLKSPLTLNNTWEGSFGTVRITANDETIDVPAGHFTGCLRVVEQGRSRGGTRTAASVYCPHVGLVSLEMRGGGMPTEVAVLRKYGPRIDPMAGDAPAVVER